MKRVGFAACLSPLCLLGFMNAFGQSSGGGDRASMETIVVTGIESSATDIAATPGGAALIDMEDLSERHVGSLADALRYAPGIWSASDDGSDEMFFSSRGSNLDATDWDMNGIKLLQDGLPVTTADGNNHNRVVDPLAARHATVARGANAFSYGASTLGGAINFVTPTARDGAGIDLRLDGGAHGHRLARATAANVFGDSLDALVTLEGKRWQGYREHSEGDRNGLYANAGWRLADNIEMRFYATYLTNDQELPGSLSRAELEANPDQANRAAREGNYRLDVDTRRLATKVSWQIDANRRFEGGFSIEEQDLFHPIVWVAVDFDGPGPAPETEVFSLLVDTDHRDVGTMLRYEQRVGTHDLLFGLNRGETDVDGGNYRDLRGRPNGLTELVNNNGTTTELFATDRWRLGTGTTLMLAAQAVSAERSTRTVDVASGAVDAPAGTYRKVNPRVGVIRELGGRGASVYGNVSRLYEPPTNYELEDNAAGGSATLAAMQGTVIEIGTRGEREFSRANRWSWDLSIYRAEIDDEILSVDDPSAPGTSLVTNVDRTTHAGVEAAFGATFELGGGASLEPFVTFTLNDFEFDRDPLYGSNELPAAPGHFVRSEVVYRGASGFYVGPTFEIVGDRWADFANTYRVDSYTVFGLRAGWARNRWRAFAELRNLEDDVYVATHGVRNVARPDDEILNPGEPRSAYFGVQVALN